MRSGNPTLSNKAFQNMPRVTGQDVMTSTGAYLKTALLLLICMGSASYTMNANSGHFVMIGLIGGFILAMVTIFKKEWATITAPLYALFEGLALGAISYMFDLRYPGIVMNAVLLTFAVMAIMLYIYSTGMIKVTDKLKKGVMIATGAIMVVYLINFVMGFFGSSISMIHSAGPLGIGFSLVVVGIATFNLLLDFDFIEKVAATGSAPKYMEWYSAFALMITLVWLYLEILRLLSKLNSRR